MTPRRRPFSLGIQMIIPAVLIAVIVEVGYLAIQVRSEQRHLQAVAVAYIEEVGIAV